jgi:hypothetical protein
MKKFFWFCLAVLSAGLFVLGWPEENNVMMVKFSETHGPSTLDSIGLLMMMIGYVPMIFTVVKRFKYISTKRGIVKPVALAVISVAALIMIAIALNISNDLLLWISVAIATICQSFLVYDAFASKETVN